MKAPGLIPAKAGIQSFQAFLDPGFRRGDGVGHPISLKLTALVPTPIHNLVKSQSYSLFQD